MLSNFEISTDFERRRITHMQAFDKNGYFDHDILQLVWKFNSPRTLFQTTISALTRRKELQSPYLHRGR